ncbi:MAG: hypothetical protein ACTSR0_05480 [Candidatus Asgardarchaeia archaeon]
MNSKKCPICGRPSEEDSIFCKFHRMAYMNVVASYDVWKDRYGEIDWKGYLKKVSSNEKTGLWAKEVAEYLLGGSRNGD